MIITFFYEKVKYPYIRLGTSIRQKQLKKKIRYQPVFPHTSSQVRAGENLVKNSIRKTRYGLDSRSRVITS